MQYREIKPSPALAPFIECFWLLENNEQPSIKAPPERLLPDGCIELILNFGARFREHTEDNRLRVQPSRFLVGQMTRPVLISPTGPAKLLGIRFNPGGTVPFLRLDMKEIANQIVSLSDVSTRLESKILERASQAQDLAEKLRLIQQLLESHLHRPPVAVTSLQPVISRILESAGRVSIDALAQDMAISARQLERRFLFDVGIGPKALCRILRFQQVFRLIDHCDENWAGVAVECGYYDQAHLIKDFQQFAGQAPTVLLEHFTPFSEQFTRKRRVSDFYNTSGY